MTPIHDSYTLRSLVCGIALVYVIRLAGSALDVMDTAALALVIALLVYQLIGLAQRLRQVAAGLGRWSIPRNLLFWTVGLMNTLWLDPELRHGFRPWVGTAFLVFAALEVVVLYRLERAWLNKRK
jgi:hypothetical protein